MQLAFSSLGCPNYTVDKLIDAAVRYGYSGVSIRTIEGQSLLTELEVFSPASITATREKFAKAGIHVVCVSSGVRFTSPDPSERSAQLAVAKRYIDIAESLGSPYVRIFGGPFPPGRPQQDVLPDIFDGFRAACDYASRKKVSVLLETHDSFSRGRDAAELVRQIGAGNLFIIWDILHSLRFGESFEETLQYISPYLRHVHIKDSLNFDQNGFDIALLGKGRIPLAAAVRLLIDGGYTGLLEFEWEKGWHPDIPEPEIAFPHGAGYLECLLDIYGRK